MAEGVIVTALEKRLDKLIALTELQNKAWERSLQLLNGIHTIVVEKQLASDKLLQEHPTVMGPEPITVGKARQPQPFNDYTDSVPYGTELEEEKEAEAETQSFPPAPAASMTSASETVVIPPRSEPVALPTPPAGERVETLEPPVQTPPKRVVTSKAEMLEQQENISRQ